MRIMSKLALAAVALGMCTTAASAAVNLTSPSAFGATAYGPGQSLVWNFSNVENSNFTYTGFFSSGVYNYTSPNWVQEPAGFPSNGTNYFGAAEYLNPETFSVNKGFFNSLSVYIGSLDTYNTISFYSGATEVATYTGSQLATMAGLSPPGSSPTDGNDNRRYFFTFAAADDVNKVVFSSSAPAFEFDNIAAAVSGVPEPATWAMMILGFGFVGFMLRGGRRQRTAVATA
jgi:hypothetical protein